MREELFYYVVRDHHGTYEVWGPVTEQEVADKTKADHTLAKRLHAVRSRTLDACENVRDKLNTNS